MSWAFLCDYWFNCLFLLLLQAYLLFLLLFSCWVMSDFLWPYGLQHTRFLCSSLSPGVQSNSCPLSQWCHLTILSFEGRPQKGSSCLQSFPASRSISSWTVFCSSCVSRRLPISSRLSVFWSTTVYSIPFTSDFSDFLNF